MSSKLAAIIGFVAGLAVAALAVQLTQKNFAGPKLAGIDPAAYYAVLLNGGQAYFGKLEDQGNGYVTLNEVYYVQTRVNPDTKETTSVLVKRGKEVHAPARMILNTASIQSIEPVGADSQIAKLIAEAKKQP